MKTVDLRSDTVTRPTPEMYKAIAEAELGDDVLGDDPTVHRLQDLAAEMTGKEAGLYLPSGSMSNQAAIATWMGDGQTLLADEDSHCLFYEGGAPATVARAMVRSVPSSSGIIDPLKISSRILAQSEHTPGTTLLVVENTHNRGGGSVTPVETMAAIRSEATRLGMSIHLDGARVFNAAAALRVPVSKITEHVDSVNFCLSKGLCAPVGSMLCGPADFIREARLWRKRLGGGMRQAGLLAACGIVALRQMTDRLVEDHARAKRLAEAVRGLPGVESNDPESNIVVLRVEATSAEWIEALGRHGVRCLPFGPNSVRLVTHHDVDDEGIDRACEALCAVAHGGRAGLQG
ncbi:MAG: low specificity L-threonine aldolase [Fimbriimonadaceae bacterium]